MAGNKKWNWKKKAAAACLLLVLAGLLGCGGASFAPQGTEGAQEQEEGTKGARDEKTPDKNEGTESASDEKTLGKNEGIKDAPEGKTPDRNEETKGARDEKIPDKNEGTEGAPDADAGELVYERSLELQYAENFSVDYYEGGYAMLTELDGTKILSMPEGGKAPDGLGKDVIVLERPVRDVYLVASAVMDMFDALDAVGAISLSGQKQEGWYIESARQAMEDGKMEYAGKYSQPDYELIVSKGCSLAIENRMVTHSPEVVEMLEKFGIPVMIEYSSSESHPLGRVEWVKFFGALLGKDEEAKKAFQEQEEILRKAASGDRTGGTVAFFFLTSNGLAQVRQSSDYVPKMIGLAGGKYVFDDLGDPDSVRSTVNIQVEEFYDGARDADFLIYNSAIDGGVSSVGELLEKCPLLGDFRAVKEGNVFCTSNDMYQQPMSIGYLIGDIHQMLAGEKEGLRFLHHLE